MKLIKETIIKLDQIHQELHHLMRCGHLQMLVITNTVVAHNWALLWSRMKSYKTIRQMRDHEYVRAQTQTITGIDHSLLGSFSRCGLMSLSNIKMLSAYLLLLVFVQQYQTVMMKVTQYKVVHVNGDSFNQMMIKKYIGDGSRRWVYNYNHRGIIFLS